MTECAACGDCCERIKVDMAVLVEKLPVIVSYGDPRDDAVWSQWVAGWDGDGIEHGDRPTHITGYIDASFILEHWSALPDEPNRATCDAFDPVTRLCTVHDDRPPVCRNFPYYGAEPTAERLADSSASTRCSFWADVPAEQRPPEWVPLKLTRL